MEKIIADFIAKSVIPDEQAQGKKIENFEKSRIILSKKKLVIATKDDKQVIGIPHIFDIKKTEVSEELKDMIEDSLKIGFMKNGKPSITVIKADGEKLDKFSYLLMRILLKGSRVIYKHPAVKGGVLLKKEWSNGFLDVEKSTILLDKKPINLSSVRDVRVEYRTIGSRQVDVLNISSIEQGDSIISYLHVPDKRTMNLLKRYVAFEYGSMLKALNKIKLSQSEKQIIQAMYSGLNVDELPVVMNMEASDVQRMVNNLERKKLLENGKLTPMGEVAVNRYMEEANV
ncbi:MAG: CheF family chemotaxis protein [Archaeoglobaceae archaeon]